MVVVTFVIKPPWSLTALVEKLEEHKGATRTHARSTSRSVAWHGVLCHAEPIRVECDVICRLGLVVFCRC
jgi:hypothetical protein